MTDDWQTAHNRAGPFLRGMRQGDAPSGSHVPHHRPGTSRPFDNSIIPSTYYGVWTATTRFRCCTPTRARTRPFLPLAILVLRGFPFLLVVPVRICQFTHSSRLFLIVRYCLSHQQPRLVLFFFQCFTGSLRGTWHQHCLLFFFFFVGEGREPTRRGAERGIDWLSRSLRQDHGRGLRQRGVN